METNITEQGFLGDDLPLSEPHFDEESTVLSARPVVPLKKVPANARFTRPWIFGLALAGALLFGISATAIYYSRLDPNEPKSTVNPETISASAEPAASEANEPDDLLPSSTVASEQPEAPVTDALPKEKNERPVVSSSTKPVTSRAVPGKPRRAEVTVVDEGSDDDMGDREERRASRREAKRIRQMRRERRATGSNDDLLRIRDIFEGRRRP